MVYQEYGAQADAEIADLSTRLTAALSDDVSDDEAIAALQAQVTSLTEANSLLNTTVLEQQAIITRKNTRIANLRAERDRLKAELAECQGTTLKK